MADQAKIKKALQDLVKREDLGNKTCCDCSNPNPQWASLSFGIFICLQCAGIHRGFGVHISFVRSISMDTWQDEQFRRMDLGGNKAFKDFISSYMPVEQGGYYADMSTQDKYRCWAATEYKSKLDAMLAGEDWAPKAPDPGSHTGSPALSSSGQGLRKSRTSGRSATIDAIRSQTNSPSLSNNSRSTTPIDQKVANEAYFTSLGQANAARPDSLPPSQGGRYQGFGNTPTPPGSSHPSYGLSSAAAPTLSNFQENPAAALSKGWSLFSAAVTGASKAIAEKATDPALQASVKGYMTEAQKKASIVGSTANQWSKQQFGIDAARSVSDAFGTVKETLGVDRPSHTGYGQVPTSAGLETSALYQDDTDDWFNEHSRAEGRYAPTPTNTTTQRTTETTPAKPAAKTSSSGWDDAWKDF
ncbi:ArfGap-domain-containing protein [Fistulina hepatica ATCC 64428]|nr:ArfGap-domain-containing protein [Fistulina hepatica ATCC 64428]